MIKNRFLQHVQKTEHIKWAWCGISYAAKRKLFPKCSFFSQESTKSCRRITFFNQKIRDLHFLCHLIWLRWFKACIRYFFIKFLFFHQMIGLQKLWKMFFISSKSSFRSQDIQIFVTFSLLFHTFQIQKGKWKWNNSWCHNLASISLQM